MRSYRVHAPCMFRPSHFRNTEHCRSEHLRTDRLSFTFISISAASPNSHQTPHILTLHHFVNFLLCFPLNCSSCTSPSQLSARPRPPKIAKLDDFHTFALCILLYTTVAMRNTNVRITRVAERERHYQVAKTYVSTRTQIRRF
jgi:hypothetical protein